MSTNKPLLGRKSPQVYRRRRAIALLALVAVIVAIVLVIVRPGSGDAAGNAATNDSAADSQSSAGLADVAAAPAPGSVEVPAAGAKDAAVIACVAADIVVMPQTDTTTYLAGSLPQLSFSLTNKGGAACSLDVGTATQAYRVTSGSETYWLSTDCQTGASSTPTVINAGAMLSSTPIAWDRTRSAKDTCSTPDRPAVPAGGASYHLAVSIGGFTSGTNTQFILN